MTKHGWMCPQCGKAHGPHVDTCPTVTTTSNKTIPLPEVRPWPSPSNPHEAEPWGPYSPEPWNPYRPQMTWTYKPSDIIGPGYIPSEEISVKDIVEEFKETIPTLKVDSLKKD